MPFATDWHPLQVIAMAMNPLRILMISEHASPLAVAGGVDAGGQNIYVAHIAIALSRLGHEVDVLTRRDAPDLAPEVQMCPGVRVFHIDAGPPTFISKEKLLPYMKEFGSFAVSLIRKNPSYDVVHANFFMSGLVGLRIQRQLGIPLVMTFHALGAVRRLHQKEADGFPSERIDMERRIAHDASCVIAECPQDAIDLMHLYGVPGEQITQVPCGVDLSNFTPGSKYAARARLGLAQDEFIVLQLGRLVPRKGIDNVIRAMGKLPSGGKYKMLIVGGGSPEPDEIITPEIARLRTIAVECQTQDKVHFVGRRDRQELRDYYVAADVFVSTPWYEPFGITPLESMACGTPVIGSAVGGIQYSVVDGVTGYLVPPHQPDALAERLTYMHAHPQEVKSLGSAGHQRVKRMFTWESVADSLAEVYEELRQKRVAIHVRSGLSLVPRTPALSGPPPASTSSAASRHTIRGATA